MDNITFDDAIDCLRRMHYEPTVDVRDAVMQRIGNTIPLPMQQRSYRPVVRWALAASLFSALALSGVMLLNVHQRDVHTGAFISEVYNFSYESSDYSSSTIQDEMAIAPCIYE